MVIQKKRPYRYLIFMVAAGLLALLLIGFYPRLMQWRAIEKAAEVEKQPSVTVVQIKADTKPIELKLPSTIFAIRETPIWSRSNGYISNFLVDIGDIVKEGELLAEIDTPEVDKELVQAQADLLSSIARLQIASISSKRWEELYKRNPQAVPMQEVDERTTSLQASLGAMEAAQANVQRLEKLQGFNKIYAPFQGTITERNIDLGTLITAGSAGTPQKLYNIAKIDVLRLFVNVPQPYFRLIHNKLTADIAVAEYPGVIFKGLVARSAGALDPVARTLLTEVHVDNKDGRLMPGVYAEVKFSLHPDVAYFIIPTQAVIIRNGGPLVALVDSQNVISLVPVKLGRDWGKTIEIVYGLKENDKVVTSPNEKIQNGIKVNIITKNEDAKSKNQSDSEAKK